MAEEIGKEMIMGKVMETGWQGKKGMEKRKEGGVQEI